MSSPKLSSSEPNCRRSSWREEMLSCKSAGVVDGLSPATTTPPAPPSSGRTRSSAVPLPPPADSTSSGSKPWPFEATMPGCTATPTASTRVMRPCNRSSTSRNLARASGRRPKSKSSAASPPPLRPLCSSEKDSTSRRNSGLAACKDGKAPKSPEHLRRRALMQPHRSRQWSACSREVRTMARQSRPSLRRALRALPPEQRSALLPSAVAGRRSAFFSAERATSLMG
mmetsp:Transcript_121049/g.270574  ORF Transcript_121049/g.270574 Transcript_121049/m.270574 type:complete len:227 (+) Transcript_121049:554-1234(+)